MLSGSRWTAGGVLLRKIAIMLREWRLQTKEEVAEQLLPWARELERSVMPPVNLGSRAKSWA
jgi:hypothetical protein